MVYWGIPALIIACQLSQCVMVRTRCIGIEMYQYKSRRIKTYREGYHDLLCISMRIGVLYQCVLVRIGVYHCVSLCIHAYPCVSMRIHAYRCVSVHIGAYQCVSVHISVYRCVFVCLPIGHSGLLGVLVRTQSTSAVNTGEVLRGIVAYCGISEVPFG
jgi:hypothetical protein